MQMKLTFAVRDAVTSLEGTVERGEHRVFSFIVKENLKKKMQKNPKETEQCSKNNCTISLKYPKKILKE